jgi:hypothetical protein
MGLHDSFEYLQHKLWPKEGLIVKMSIWLPTLKVNNHPELCMFKGHATYCWKALDKGYNFFWNLTLIKGWHKKL